MMSYIWKGGAFAEYMRKAATAAVVTAGIMYQSRVKMMLSGRASNKGRTPSPPGQPPAKDTGMLGRSIQMDDGKANDPHRPLVRVGTKLKYAPIHEFGGTITAKNAPALRFKIGDQWVMVKSVTLPPRPFMRPALRAARMMIVATIRERLHHAVREWRGGTP